MRGNRAILDASKQGRVLRVFFADGRTATYQGRFELDQALPYYTADAPESGGGPVRTVLVFRLRAVDTPPRPPQGLPAVSNATKIANVPIEERNTERAFVEPDREPYTAERRESELVHRFKRWAEERGRAVERLKITPAGEAKPIFTDTYLTDGPELVEAKGSTDRNAIRMAIGQLCDYRRFVPASVTCAVLLPELLREDLQKLLASAGWVSITPMGLTSSCFRHDCCDARRSDPTGSAVAGLSVTNPCVHANRLRCIGFGGNSCRCQHSAARAPRGRSSPGQRHDPLPVP